jgi:hypothetical protein
MYNMKHVESTQHSENKVCSVCSYAFEVNKDSLY